MPNIPTHASTGKSKSHAPGGRTRSSGVQAQGVSAAQTANLKRANHKGGGGKSSRSKPAGY